MKKIFPLHPLLFLLWFCIKWISIGLASDAFQADPDSYRALAIELRSTGVFGANSQPTAFRPPLYPWVLSFGVRNDQSLDVTFVKLLHSTLGALTCIFVFFSTTIAQNFLRHPGSKSSSGEVDSPHERPFQSWSKQIVAPTLSATLVAIDPILLRQSQLIMTETLATFLAALTLWCMLKAYKKPTIAIWLLAGMGIGLSILCRPTAIVWGGLFIVAFWVGWYLLESPTKLPLKRIVYCTLSFALGVFAFVLPWAVRNNSELNRWVFTTTHGGYTLLLANNHSLYEHFEKTSSRDWDDSAFQTDWKSKIVGLSELEQDRLANSQANETIQQRPLLFVKSCLIRLGWLWIPWPNQSSDTVKIIIGIWYTTVYLVAILGAAFAYRSASFFWSNPLLVPVACLILSLSMVHSVYWSNLRMRAVAMPALYMLASIPVSLKIRSTAK